MKTRILTAALAAACLFAGNASAQKAQNGKPDKPANKERKAEVGKPAQKKGKGRMAEGGKQGAKMGQKNRAEKKSGTFVGTLAAKDGGKIVVESPNGRMEFIPYWRGGAPDKGGGFDKEMMKQLEGFEKGDRVQVKWVFEEHNRIDQIKKLDGKGPDKPNKPPRGEEMRKQRGEGRGAPALTEEQRAEWRAKREEMRKQRGEGRGAPALTEEQKAERRAKREEMRKRRANADSK